MVVYGPIQLLALGFPETDKLKGELLKEIFRLSDGGMIRVIGLLAIVKDKQGQVASAQMTEFSDQERQKLGAAIGALIGLGAAGKEGAMAGAEAGAKAVASKEFGLTPEQIKVIARDMPNDTAAGLLLIEHLWAKKFKEIARKQHGVVLANGFIMPEAFIALGAELAEGAEAAEKVKLQ
jgi:uncharacterized membrane protein